MVGLAEMKPLDEGPIKREHRRHAEIARLIAVDTAALEFVTWAGRRDKTGEDLSAAFERLEALVTRGHDEEAC